MAIGKLALRFPPLDCFGAEALRNDRERSGLLAAVLLAEYRKKMQVRKELQGLPLEAHDLKLMAARYQPLVEKNEDAEARAIDKLNFRKVQNDIVAGAGQAFDFGPHPGNAGSIEIVVDVVFLSHCTLYLCR